MSIRYYKKVLTLDPSCVEAISCLAATYFYSDQPEVALRFYRRLLQIGSLPTTELMNNIGLCCFYSGQYDLALSCFEYALQLANDSNMTEVWYNIGCVAISLGDTGLAQQAFGITLNLDNTYAEAYVNLGILEQRKGNLETTKAPPANAITK